MPTVEVSTYIVSKYILGDLFFQIYRRLPLARTRVGCHLDIDELDYISDRLLQTPRLAYTWGFRPSSRRRPEWALRQVAFNGDPKAPRY